jgi:peptidoglycan/LPS O-acetylase OafA/YrhL
VNKDISNTLKVGSFIATILVVAIHYHSISLIPEECVGNLNFYIQSFIRDGLGRFAVPYFALLSGYFAVRKERGWSGYKSLLKKKGLTLLLPYVIASYFIFWSSSFIEILIQDSNALTMGQILSWSKGALFHPCEQLWYLRDLMLLILLVPLLINTPRKFRTGLSFFLGVLWLFEIQAFPLFKGWYLINIETIFFFTLGGVLYRTNLTRFRKYLDMKSFMSLFFLWFLLVGARILIKPDFFIWYSSDYTLFSLLLYKGAILLGIPMLFLFSYGLRNREKLLYLSGLDFFVYLYHFFPLFYFRKLTAFIIPGDYSFYVDFPIALFVSYGLGWLFYYRFSGINRIITGARHPQEKESA